MRGAQLEQEEVEIEHEIAAHPPPAVHRISHYVKRQQNQTVFYFWKKIYLNLKTKFGHPQIDHHSEKEEEGSTKMIMKLLGMAVSTIQCKWSVAAQMMIVTCKPSKMGIEGGEWRKIRNLRGKWRLWLLLLFIFGFLDTNYGYKAV
jgi:hypothetical protein